VSLEKTLNAIFHLEAKQSIYPLWWLAQPDERHASISLALLLLLFFFWGGEVFGKKSTSATNFSAALRYWCFVNSCLHFSDALGEYYQQYITFVIDSLYLRAPTRAYNRSEEKWEVLGQCLELFNKILLQYQPHSDDFFDEKSFSKSPDDAAILQAKSSLKHPGMPLLCHVYNEGNFFKTVNFIAWGTLPLSPDTVCLLPKCNALQCHL